MRPGWAHGPYMWYATAGGAVAQIETRYTLMSSPGNSGLQAPAAPFGPGSFAQWGLPGGVAGESFTRTRIGWTVGGGVETAIGDLFGLPGLGNRFTMKLEYLYVDLGRMTNVIGAALVPVCAGSCANPATGSTLFTSSVHVSEQIVRLGWNYKFDTAVPAVPMIHK
jgi:outer membrane immunogenic protein